MPFFVFSNDNQTTKPWMFSFRGKRDTYMEITLNQYIDAVGELIECGLFRLTGSSKAIKINNPIEIVRCKYEKRI